MYIIIILLKSLLQKNNSKLAKDNIKWYNISSYKTKHKKSQYDSSIKSKLGRKGEHYDCRSRGKVYVTTRAA